MPKGSRKGPFGSRISKKDLDKQKKKKTKRRKWKKTNKFVSKLQIKNFASTNEINMGYTIKKILHYTNYYAPIISSEVIKIQTFDNIKKLCSAYKKHPKRQFILSKLHYLEGEVLNDYISNNITNRKLFMYLLDCYIHLLNGVLKLNEEGIIHFDLKGDNIVFNNKLNIPIIIDFGLSISLKSVKKNIKNYFYIYAPTYYCWPLEVHFFNYIIHVNKYVTIDDIKKVCREYISGNMILQSQLSKEFINKYEKLCIKTLENLLPLTYIEKEEKILEMAYTWDNYSLSIIYLKYIHYFNAKGYIKNNFITFFSKLLMQNIHPNYTKRHTIKETIHLFEEFWYDETIHNSLNFIEIYANIERTALQMRHIIMKDIKKERKLKRLITVKFI